MYETDKTLPNTFNGPNDYIKSIMHNSQRHCQSAANNPTNVDSTLSDEPPKIISDIIKKGEKLKAQREQNQSTS